MRVQIPSATFIFQISPPYIVRNRSKISCGLLFLPFSCRCTCGERAFCISGKRMGLRSGKETEPVMGPGAVDDIRDLLPSLSMQ